MRLMHLLFQEERVTLRTGCFWCFRHLLFQEIQVSKKDGREGE